MERKKSLIFFDNLIDYFYTKLKSLLIIRKKNNMPISINRLQNKIECGFTTGMKLKRVLIDLGYIDEKGYVIIEEEEINKLEKWCKKDGN